MLLFTSGIALVRLISGEAGAGGDLRFLDALKKQQKDLKIEKSIWGRKNEENKRCVIKHPMMKKVWNNWSRNWQREKETLAKLEFK